VDYTKVKWSSTLKLHLSRRSYAQYSPEKVRIASYRPFNKRYLYYDELLIDRPALFKRIVPASAAEDDNEIICVSGPGGSGLSYCLATNVLPDFHFTGTSGCLPLRVYDQESKKWSRNVGGQALEQFRERYGDRTISDRDVFYYVYGLLHHQAYRETFREDLKRELPRIPFAPDFRAFANAGKQLARLHIYYEKLDPYPLNFIETPEVPLSYRVEDKMRLSKDKTALVVNPSLALSGIPPETFDYRLGNRSALESVIDQYQVSEDKRSGIRSDPNREDDPEYIVRLVGQVVRVSLETVRIVAGLPAEYSDAR
jgi:predicted helicase